MRSKKAICTILTVLISFSLVSTSYASEGTASNIITSSTADPIITKISKDAAKQIARQILKDYFDTDIDETQYQASVNLQPDYSIAPMVTNPIWHIYWGYHDDQKDMNIDVSVDASTGKVINVNDRTLLHENASKAAAITEDQAKKAGEIFLKKIAPEEFSQSKLTNNDDYNMYKGDPNTYNFNYCRVVNGNPFLGDYINVGVDNITGKICSYSINWTDKEIPSQDGIIPNDKADQILKDNLKLDLKYITYRDEYGYYGEVPTVKLVYMLNSANGISIDAKEGKLLDYNNIDVPDKKTRDLDKNQKKSFLACYKPVQKLASDLDSSSAEAIMKQMVKDLYGDEYDIESTSYQENNYGYGNYVNCWAGQFTKKDSKNGFEDQGQICIDSSTGQLISINKFNPMDRLDASYDGSESKLTWDQAYDKTMEILKKYFAYSIKDINTEQVYTKSISYYNNVPQVDRFYGFNFSRLVNAISYQDDNINISFDAKTGEVYNIYSKWTNDLKVPSTEGIINVNTAQDIFFKKYNPKLAYSLINTSKDYKNPVMQVKLVYSIFDGSLYSGINNIDAFTGKFVDYNGQEVTGNMSAFKAKIKGNPAEKELSILASQGIIDTKNFDLNKKVTRADMIKMLVNAKGYAPYFSKNTPDLKIKFNGAKGDVMYKYLQSAVSYGILDNSGEFKGDEIITREEMVKYIVKLLRYDDIAKTKGIFKVPYIDAAQIAPDNTGYVAISKALGLTNDAGNKFRPKDQATIIDASIAIYKALGKIRNY